MAADLKDQLQAALGASYILERELGRGGMATVFLAQDAKHGRPVALKVLHQDLAASLGPERFRREITLAAKLQHPHILTVLDSGETLTGDLWFTMPYVEGESLRNRLSRQRQLAVPDALRITREVALALEYAHRHGVIHRDVKPENILLTTDGQALVADFGIARALTTGTTGGTLTETGMAIGTPQYMSPEQAAGERTLDGTSDVYSLGAVLYEMLAGEPPYTGPTAQAIVAKMMAGKPPSVRRARPSVPAAIDAALEKALAPVPADRFPTALEFSKALDAAATIPDAPATTPSSRAIRARRRLPVGASLLGLGFLIGVGMLFAWRHHTGATDAGPVRIAVLPFENLGDSADAYFADGLTDAVRTKLTSLPGLEVIGSASSAQYRHTAKSPQVIGRELDVRYLLTGKVRWDKSTGTESQVEVSPELVDATTAADKWAAPFDAPLTRVFEVQADIAGKVAQQLKVALTPAREQALDQRPTSDLAAYDAYLRADELLKQEGATPANFRQALGFYREAVSRDSTFALAWAGLAEVYADLYGNFGIPTAALADSADTASARALALAPNLAAAHIARAFYYGEVLTDGPHAIAEAESALARAPTDPWMLFQAGESEDRFGSQDAAVAHLEQAARLDPRDGQALDALGFLETSRHHYDTARAALDKAVALRPDNLNYVTDRATVALGQGDLAGARAILRAAPATGDPASLVAYVATFGDLGWVLDSTQAQRLLTLRPDEFGGDRATWGLVLAQQYAFRGDHVRSRIYADSARIAFEGQLKSAPFDAQHGQRHAELAVALAYLGRETDAIREGERAVSLVPIAKDALFGPYNQHQLARVYIILGQPDKALDLLEPLLRISYWLSPGWLRIDPNFAPLRGNPRFERLVAGR